MNDVNRPVYHFMPPRNWMNDPKLFFHDGVYHVFFQYNPDAPGWGLMRWGHTISRDLVHWTQLPNALTPTPGSPDKDGCWTGCVISDGDRFHILYTGVNPQTQCLATSKDLITWEKYSGNPVISGTPKGFGDCFRDPCAWKEGDTWYVIIGSEQANVGGAALLYESRDLIHWKYLHPLYTGDKAVDGAMFECPDFFPLDGKYVLLSSCGVTHWHIGTYRDHKLTSHDHGVTDGGHFYAAKTLVDDKGRRILWGWVTESRSPEEMAAAGWAGLLSLPRVLNVHGDGTLRYAPPAELNALRGQHWESRTIKLESSDTPSIKILDDVRGNAVEIIARFKPNGAKRVGLLFRSTPDRSESQCVYADLEHNVLVAGTGAGDASAQRVQAAYEVKSGEEVELHLFLDHSVAETFANGRACLTSRSYTQRTDASGVGVFSTGGPAECTLEAWEMKSR